MRSLTAAVRDHADRLFRYHDVSGPAGPASDPPAADLIVGLGSYQPAVAEHCACLFAAGVAPRILFTGGLGNWTRGLFERPEAEIFRDRAVACGVPAAAILVEPAARNLGDNAVLSRELVTALGAVPRTLAVVTKRNTTRRAMLTFRRAWPEVDVTLHGPDLPWTGQAVPPRTAEDVVDEMVGDLQRILVYPALGHQVPDRVPPDVLASYRALVAAGFDRHLLAGHPVLPADPPTPEP